MSPQNKTRVTTTSRVAWVLDENCYNRDGDGESSERTLQQAWVFPSGLDMGCEVHFFEKSSYKEWTRYGCHEDTSSQKLAIGEVASIIDNVVKFTWGGAASQEDGCAWCISYSPNDTLTMKPSKDHHYSQRGGRRNDTSTGTVAQRHDDCRIDAPDEAWALLPRLSVVFTVLSTHVEKRKGGLVLVRLVTLAGNEFEVYLNIGSQIQMLMNLIAKQRQLRPSSQIKLVDNTGVELSPSDKVDEIEFGTE